MSKLDIQRHSSIFASLILFAVVFRTPSRAGEVREWFSLLFEVAVMLSFAGVLYRRNKWIAAFLILTIFSSFYPHYGPMSMLASRSVFFGCVWFYLLTEYLEDVTPIYNIMCVSVLIHTFVAAAQNHNLSGAVTDSMNVGLMSNPLEFAALLVICLPAFFREKWCFFIPVVAYGVFISGQFLGIMLFCLAGVLYLKRWVITIVGGMTAGAFLLVDTPNILGRVDVWILTLHCWLEHPFGAGIGHWKAVFDKPMSSGLVWHTAHNEFLQTLFEVGILFIPLLFGYLWSIRKKLSVIPGLAMIMILLESGAEFIWHIAPIAMISLTWMAIIEREDLCEKIRI